MRTFWPIFSPFCVLLFAGCAGMQTGSTVQTNLAPGAALQGKVRAGQNPIASASVYLYAASTTGYGSASVSLLNSPGDVTTDSGGNFTITGDYSCPNANSQVYLYAIGGNPGLAEGTNNTAAGLLAGLGSCGSLTPSTYIVIDEVSTIATAYAIAGYATDTTHVSSSGSTLALTGVANAMAAIPNMETLSTGAALATTPGGNGTVPQAEINTLANILAGCVNSGGPSSTACSTLFSHAMNGSTAPTDTATAAINIAHNPGANVGTLYGLATASAPFQPVLSAAPNDFTIAISYTGGGLVSPTASPTALAIDKLGNVWVGSSASAIVEFSPAGQVLSGSSGFKGGGLNGPYGIAIDGTGNVWVSNYGNSISEYNPTSGWVSASGYTGGGLNRPLGIAIDASEDVWVADGGGIDISEFSSSGTAMSGSSGFTGGGLGLPTSIAIDTSGNVWLTNEFNNVISEFSSSGTAVSASGYFGGGLDGAKGIAIDASGKVWAANNGDNSLSEYNPENGWVSPANTGFTGGGLTDPWGLAIDGSGNVWVSDASTSGSCCISEFNSSGVAISPSTGYQGGGLYFAEGIAIDGSGNVWAVNTSAANITEFVGAAIPVVTPVVANLLSPYGKAAVNKP